MMIRIIAIVLVFINVNFGQDDKIYVSTFGQKIEIVDEVHSSNPHTLYAIKNEKQKSILLSSIFNYTKKDSNGVNLLFNFFAMQLNNNNYETHTCYVLLSALSYDLEINQPFHYENSSALIFEIKYIDAQQQHYIYARTYKVKNEDDIYDKYILENNNKIKMEPVIL